jgi:hypothetical protein
MISIDGWQKVQQDTKSGECLELHQYALSFMLIACISSHAGMLFMIQKTQDEAIRTVVR